MTVQSPDLISELLRGMRLSGVKYRPDHCAVCVLIHPNGAFHSCDHRRHCCPNGLDCGLSAERGNASLFDGNTKRAAKRTNTVPVGDFPNGLSTLDALPTALPEKTAISFRGMRGLPNWAGCRRDRERPRK